MNTEIIETKNGILRIITPDDGKVLINKNDASKEYEEQIKLSSTKIFLGINDASENYIEIDAPQEEIEETETIE